MKYSLPIRNLLKYSILLTLAVSLITFLGTFMKEPSLVLVCTRVITTFFLFTFFCLINVCLIRGLQENNVCVTGTTSHQNRKLFAIGAFLSYLIFLASHFFNIFLIDNKFVPESLLHDDFKSLGNWTYVFIFFVSIMMYAMVFVLHNFIILEDWKSHVEIENSRLKSVNADTVNQLLKQQIQPHFLFNALNVLKSLIRKQPDVAEEYLISLSDFLRASVNQNKKTLATLREELKICNDYMEMQKIRFGNAIDFEIQIAETEISESDFLPVFSLQPLVENAIKHNELTTASPLHIRIIRENEWIEVINNLQTKNSISESTGNGLSNLAERYRIIAGTNIQIEEVENSFKVRIKVLAA